MKAAFILATVFLSVARVAVGQEFVAQQLDEEVPIRPIPEDVTVRPTPTIDGIVAKVFDVDRPWQLVNPVAPESYGNGQTNETVSRDPNEPGKPDGFILFALDW